ncbi:16S rRNA processing protein RimM [Bacillus pakistanensis]|uniref:Ribosome maturation factor RimM n=1 Tax=Rossellomorea pakistanensis TaxID=992288 RepID=A0ABS2NG51_9BACI|nr:ribosome maturation factor RimM [Bacillus pakistanensis]MBM7586809.1 16S rRNA processing protein RimM [Bacillus pakistanensis]
MDKWFNVGKIVNTHGVRGEVRVISRTDFPEERYELGNTLYLFSSLQEEPLPLVVKSHRRHKNFDLLTFEGFDNISQVEPFKGSLLKVPEEQLSELEEGEFYFHEIIGCHVITIDGQEIGIVKEILSTGANDVWVVKGNGNKEHLIPFIDDVVKEVNIDDKQIIIEPMEGLLQ